MLGWQSEEYEADEECSSHTEEDRCVQNLEGLSKKPLEKYTLRWENNIKMDVREEEL